MKFLSIDSSMANTGIAMGTIGPTGIIMVANIDLVETAKTKNKQIRASSDTISRGRTTHRFIQNALALIKPDVVFIETPSGSQNSSAMKSYGMTCQLIAGLLPPPIEVTPTEVKVGSIGNKTASKNDMIQWAMNAYPKLPWQMHAGKPKAKNEHMADAIAIAWAGILTPDFLRVQHQHIYE